MDSFDRATNWLVSQLDIGKTLKLIDDYIQRAEKMGSVVVPKEHKEVQPFVDRFVKDFPGFVAYVKDLRANFMGAGIVTTIDDAYSTFEVRRQGQMRHARERRLAKKYIEKNGEFPNYEARVRYLTKAQQTWVHGRKIALAEAKRRKGSAISSDERAQVVEEYWAAVDAAIEKGVIPNL